MQYTSRFFLPIRDLGAKYTVMQAAMTSAERIFGVLDLTPGHPVAASRPGGPPRARGRPRWRSAEVWFGYREDQWILQGCSFEVRRGEHVALVGATGEGKTTCGRLLTRAYDVARGRVLVDGVDVRDWDLARLRRHVGVVFQESVLFTGSVEANLARGRRRAGAARGAGAGRPRRPARGRFIEALPRGWRTELSERGANISHGERQLLAMARALVYNPAILVLDEATSSIDPESEALIQAAMSRLLAGRTSITIAHRLSTIQSADRILVLHRGQIHEEGTHEALLRRGGLYARFCELQFGVGVRRVREGSPTRQAAVYRLVRRIPPRVRAHVRGDRRAGGAAGRGPRRGARDARLPARHPVASRGERPRRRSARALARAGW